MRSLLTPLLAASLGGLFLPACAGLLIIEPPVNCVEDGDCGFGFACVEGKCVTVDDACSTSHLDGYCGDGLQCACGGICVPPDHSCVTDGTEWCDCPAEQGCIDNNCVVIDATNSCSPTRLAGACPHGQTCAGGYCTDIPAGNGCGPEQEHGWCGPGLTCVRGTCEPTSNNPCTSDNTSGHCPDATVCSAGTCVLLPCSPSSVGPGVCDDTDSICSGDRCQCGLEVECLCEVDTCTGVPCGAEHPNGACYDGDGNVDPTLLCSPSADGCVEVGECASDEDCAVIANNYCNPDVGRCAFPNRCWDDADCEVRQVTELGQGYECVGANLATNSQGNCLLRTTCVDEHDCLPADICSSAGRCLQEGFCDGDADCDLGGGDTMCSFQNEAAGTRQCIQVECRVDKDCTDGPNPVPDSKCGASNRCLGANACDAVSDCPPGHACNCPAGSTCNAAPFDDKQCEPRPDECSTNEQTHVGCTAGDLLCCAIPGQCCNEGLRCSIVDAATNHGVCILDGQCIDDGDCIAGLTECDTETYTCVPLAAKSCDPFATNCGGPGRPCPACDLDGADGTPGTTDDEYCSFGGGCLTSDRCLSNFDCRDGEECDAAYTCVPRQECGPEVLTTASLAKPNMLVVLDRSGSMEVCAGTAVASQCCGAYANSSTVPATTGVTACDCDLVCGAVCSPDCFKPRWDQAVDAVNGLISTKGSQIEFGLSTYPEQCPALNPDPEPGTPCASEADCPAGEFCYVPGGGGTRRCLTECTSDADCAPDQSCDLAPALPPYPFGGLCFTNPRNIQDASQDCNVECNFCSCNGFCDWDGNGFPDGGAANKNPGVVDFPVGAPGYQTTIPGLLSNVIFPGGETPTGPTLRNVLDDPIGAGLIDPTVENVVLLVTDGEASTDSYVVSQCEPPCGDGVQDGDETGIDCGGSCDACPDAAPCARRDDCQSGICRAGVCRPLSCGDGGRNGTETDVDCGDLCGPCGDDFGCGVNTDCASGHCDVDVCVASDCGDGFRNGGETDVDCGGECGGCADDLACARDDDCSSGVCQAGTCRPATCGNGTHDPAGGETDTDCGGTTCGPCADGLDCAADGDCRSTQCTGTVCALPTCANGAQDPGETDVDCGGPCGNTCGAADLCSTDGDCISGECRTCPASDGACRVDAAVDRLFGLDPRIKTYVVGFAFATVSDNLNCNAVHGRTAREDNCAGVSRTSRFCDTSGQPCTTDADCGGGVCEADCERQANACYYEANDQATLQAAFEDIISEVLSCEFSLVDVPPNPSRIFVYIDEAGDLVRVDRDPTQQQGWNYDPIDNQIEFFGNLCDRIRAGEGISPIVVRGDCPGEGCCP